MLTKEQINCRICRSSGLRPVINLGAQPLANGFRPKGDARTEERIPLCVCFCADCGLCQLSHVVSPEALFRNDYVYFSGKMPSALAHFGAYAEELPRDYLLPSDLVLEIGSNDGVLLQEFLKRGFSVLGVDPALNVAEEANRRGIPTLPGFLFLRRLTSLTCLKTGHLIPSTTNTFRISRFARSSGYFRATVLKFSR